ncbi:MAG: SPOR domain-containing protein [Chlorobium sp.]|nr:MAG: SPOR domain-containing protein [Chlorobium sp.]
MIAENTIFLFRKSITSLCVALSVIICFPMVLHAAVEHSYAQEIRQYVAEDKVYLLENIRQKVTIPSEKTVVEALLSEDGPQALSLYRKQLMQYPDPQLDQLSTSRIAAYTKALESNAPPPKLSVAAPAAAKPHVSDLFDSSKHSVKPLAKSPSPSPVTPKPVKKIAGQESFTLQFGSFENRQNAETLAKKISPHAPVEIVPQGERYKVLLKKNFASKKDAAAEAKELSFDTIVVPAN